MAANIANPNMAIDLHSQDTTQSKGELTCHVTDPEGVRLSVEIVKVSARGREIRFWPTIIGKHLVYIYYGDQLIAGCPYIVDVKEEDIGQPKKY